MSVVAEQPPIGRPPPDLKAFIDREWYSPAESRPESPEAKSRFKILTAAELDASEFKIEYLVEGVLVKGQPAVLAAPLKCLKTTISLDLAISLATGTWLLGKFPVFDRTPTLVMSGESGLATIKETCGRICRSRGLTFGQVEGLFVSDRVPMISDRRDLADLVSLLEQTQAKVLVCDPLYLMLQGAEASNLFVMGQQLRELVELCETRQVTLVLLHHTKNSSRSGNSHKQIGLTDMSWAGTAEIARQWLLLNRRKTYSAGTGSHALWFNYGGSAGHSGSWQIDIEEGPNDAASGRDYQVTVSEPDVRVTRSASETSARPRRTEAERFEYYQAKVLEALQTLQPATPSNTWVSKTAISGSTGINHQILGRVLGTMRQAGLILEKIGNRGPQETYSYKLVVSETEAAAETPIPTPTNIPTDLDGLSGCCDGRGSPLDNDPTDDV